jgi:hypothetical protein
MKVYLIFILNAFVFLAGTLQASAQQNREAPLPERQVSICYLYARSTPELYFKTNNGTYEQLKIDTVRFSNWNDIPALQSLPLYQQGRDPETGAVIYAPVMSLGLPAGDAPVRILFYFTDEGKVQRVIFSEEATTHTAGQVLAINLLDVPSAVSLAGKKEVIRPKKTHVFDVEAQPNERFPLVYAYQLPGQSPYVSGEQRLRFFDGNSRGTLLLAYVPVDRVLEDAETTEIGFEVRYLFFLEDL